MEYPEHLGVEQDPSVLEAYAQDALFVGKPQALARPRTVEQLQAVMAYCHQHDIGVTPCGSRTSMTGGSVADGHLSLSTEHLSKEWRVYEDPAKPGRWLCDVGPAILLADFQEQLAAKGFFYPPDPTSRRDAAMAATIATNASGEDTYKYGPTRAWVRGLTYVTADGRLERAERPADQEPDRRKNTCGFPLREHDIDLLIGSEGTLGIVVDATVEVLPFVPTYFAILFFLPDENSALDTVRELHDRFQLRCLEYMDAGAVAILREKGVDVPDDVGAALYAKQEFTDDEDERMGEWAEYLETRYEQLARPDLMEHVHFAGDDAAQDQLRTWRHHIPATINERAARYRNRHGGGKVGTDWYVPLDALKTMFAEARLDQGDMEWVVFGHIGNGHPHFNFVAKDAEEYARARGYLLEHCRKAVALGGGVSGEHGLGKLKTHLLELQYDAAEIQAMRAVKRRFDPKGILGRGNIFTEQAVGAV